MDIRVRCVLVALVTTTLPYLASRPAQARTALSVSTAATNHCIFDHLSLWTPAGVCRPRARVYPSTVKGTVQRAIYDGSLTFGIPFQVLLQIGACESGLNPRASNGSHFGVFQFAPDTFRTGAKRMRVETGIVARSYWSPLDSTYVAGYYFVSGHSLSWSCEHPSG